MSIHQKCFTAARQQEIKAFIREILDKPPTEHTFWEGEDDFDVCIDSSSEDDEVSITLFHTKQDAHGNRSADTSAWHRIPVGVIYSDEPLDLPPLTFGGAA